MKLYTGLLVVLVALLSLLLLTRKDVDATIMRTPGMLYQERGADSVTNLYNIKIANKTSGETPLRLQIENGRGRVEVVGGSTVAIKKEEESSGTFFIVLPVKEIHERKSSIKIGLYQGDKKIDEISTNFLGPESE